MTENTAEPSALWEADASHPELAEEIRAGLRQVIDPELGLSIIELGLVREVKINDDKLDLMMILTTPFCPYGPALLEMARAKGEEVSGKPTTIELNMEVWDPSMMEDGVGADWGLF